MKAKVKATGIVVEANLNRCAMPVAGYGASSIYECSDGKNHYDTELDFINVYPDWQQVKIQAAMFAMQGILANNTCNATIEEITDTSVKFADTLVRKLQKEMEVKNE